MPVKSIYLSIALTTACMIAGSAQAAHTFVDLPADPGQNGFLSQDVGPEALAAQSENILEEANQHLAAVGAKSLDEDPVADWHRANSMRAASRDAMMLMLSNWQRVTRTNYRRHLRGMTTDLLSAGPSTGRGAKRSTYFITQSKAEPSRARPGDLAGHGLLTAEENSVLSALRTLMAAVQSGIGGTLRLLGVSATTHASNV